MVGAHLSLSLLFLSLNNLTHPMHLSTATAYFSRCRGLVCHLPSPLSRSPELSATATQMTRFQEVAATDTRSSVTKENKLFNMEYYMEALTDFVDFKSGYRWQWSPSTTTVDISSRSDKLHGITLTRTTELQRYRRHVFFPRPWPAVNIQ